MTSKKASGLGGWGWFFRIVLLLLNTLALALGIVIVAVLGLYKNSSVFDYVKNNQLLDQLFEEVVLSGVDVALLVLGCFLMCVGLYGIIVACSMHFKLILLYEVLLFFIFVIHLVIFLAFLIMSPRYEENLRKELNNIIDKINNAALYGTSISQMENTYTLLKAVSVSFSCCGINDPSDFNPEIREKTCHDIYAKNACGDTLLRAINLYGIYICIIPSAIAILLELFTLLFVPYLLKKSVKKSTHFNSI